MQKFKKILIIGVLLLIFVSCNHIVSKIQHRQEKEPEELVLWSYYEVKNQQLSMDELIKGFNNSQENYHLTWEYQGPVTEFRKKLAIGITQDQLPDMVIVDNPDMPYYISIDQFEDITKEIKEIEKLDEYFKNAMKAVQNDGKYYGLPFCCNNVALIYNKDIFMQENMEIPQTLQELKTAAQALSSKERYGFAMSAINGEQGAFQFAAFMLSAGDSLEGAGGQGTLYALKFLQDLIKKKAMSSECVNWSQNDVARIFIAGKCAMMENGPWVFPALEEAEVNYGIAPFPAGENYKGILGGEDLAVIKGKNVKGSIEFFKYYGKTKNMLNSNLMANALPPRKDVAQLFLNIKPEYEVILSQVQYCISRASYDGWTELSGKLSDGLYQVLIGEKSAKQVCKEIRAE